MAYIIPAPGEKYKKNIVVTLYGTRSYEKCRSHEGYDKGDEHNDLKEIYDGLLQHKWQGLGIFRGQQATAAKAEEIFRKADFLMIGGHGKTAAVWPGQRPYIYAAKLDSEARQCRWLLVAACSEVQVANPQGQQDLSNESPYRWLKANPFLHAVLGYQGGAAWYGDMVNAKSAGARFATELHQGKTVTEAWMDANKFYAPDAPAGFGVRSAATFSLQDNDGDMVGTPDAFPTAQAVDRTHFVYKMLTQDAGLYFRTFMPHKRLIL